MPTYQLFDENAARKILQIMMIGMTFPDENTKSSSCDRSGFLGYLLENGYIDRSTFIDFVRTSYGEREFSLVDSVRFEWRPGMWPNFSEDFPLMIINGGIGFELQGDKLIVPEDREDARGMILSHLLRIRYLTDTNIHDAVHESLLRYGRAQAETVVRMGRCVHESASPHAIGYAILNRSIGEVGRALRYREEESARTYMNLAATLETTVYDQLQIKV
jgi:hypothetical protein